MGFAVTKLNKDMHECAIAQTPDIQFCCVVAVLWLRHGLWPAHSGETPLHQKLSVQIWIFREHKTHLVLAISLLCSIFSEDRLILALLIVANICATRGGLLKGGCLK